MPEQSDFIKSTTIKSYIKEVEKIRSSQEAINEISSKFNSLIVTVIREAGKLAKESNRNTIMLEDITTAFEKHVGKRHLTWEEVLQEIILQTPADLGKISKGINDHIEKDKK